MIGKAMSLHNDKMSLLRDSQALVIDMTVNDLLRLRDYGEWRGWRVS